MSKLVEGDSETLPEFVDITEENLNKYLPYWKIYRSVDRKISFIEAVTLLPEEMISTFLTLDDIFARIEIQENKRNQNKEQQ